jgi:plastocyanin
MKFKREYENRSQEAGSRRQAVWLAASRGEDETNGNFRQIFVCFVIFVCLIFSSGSSKPYCLPPASCLLPPVLEPRAEVKVTAKVELLNSRVKARDGKIDASGVVIWLDSIEGNSSRGPRAQQKIIQRGKRFSPHVMAVERGTEVYFPNLDPFFHNVFSMYEGKRFDLGLYASGETRPVTFNRAGISYIFCNIHPQMSAIVVTLGTPYFGISDEDGGVTISNVPEGHYQLKIWHERTSDEELAAQSRTVRVAAGAAGGHELGVIKLNEAGYLPQPHQNKHGGQYDNENSKPSYKRQ